MLPGRAGWSGRAWSTTLPFGEAMPVRMGSECEGNVRGRVAAYGLVFPGHAAAPGSHCGHRRPLRRVQPRRERHACGRGITPNTNSTAMDAAAAVEKATQWLLDRCQKVPPEAWHARDPSAQRAVDKPRAKLTGIGVRSRRRLLSSCQRPIMDSPAYKPNRRPANSPPNGHGAESDVLRTSTRECLSLW
jgi:hypothetical protein